MKIFKTIDKILVTIMAFLLIDLLVLGLVIGCHYLFIYGIVWIPTAIATVLTYWLYIKRIK